MAQPEKVREAFLLVLGEGNNKEEIRQRTQYFADQDWQALYALLTDHGLFPAFYTKLLALKLENIPPDFLAKLKNIYFLNLQRNLFLEQEFLRILNHLQDSDIPVIPLKGPLLARLLYGDSGLRQVSVDLDLLVSQETVSQVREKLAQLGYCLSGLEQKKDFLSPRDLSEKIKQILFSKQIDKRLSINLDVHFCIRGFFMDAHIQGLWQQARYLDLDGHRVLMLSPEDTLLYLSAISITTLEFVQLKYLYDIHRLVTTLGKELNWDKLFYKAKNLNLTNCLYLPLNLSTILFSTCLPQTFLNAIEPGWLLRRLIGRYINEKKVLETRQKVYSGFILRYLLSRYLYSKDQNDFLNKVWYRILKGGGDERASSIKEESGYC